MSTADTNGQRDATGERKPKRAKVKGKPVARACDMCRRKRSDGSEGSGDPCPNCLAFKTECTYDVPLKKHGPPKGYVRMLEARIAKLESLLREDGCNVEKEVGLPLDKDSIRRTNGSLAESLSDIQSRTSSRSSGDERVSLPAESLKNYVHDSDVASSDEEFIESTLGMSLNGLTLDPVHQRFLGKSSGISMIKTAIVMKAENARTTPTCQFGAFRRKEFWSPQPWEMPTYKEEHPTYRFPDTDLMENLIGLYFHYVHDQSPCLHRQSLEANFNEGLYLRDNRFASILLMVCAVASRFSDDERVFIKSSDGSFSTQSAGWQWFNQVQMVRRSLVAPPSLYDLQLYNLFFVFLVGSQAPHAAWVVVGHAIRLAQDVGAHKRKFYGIQRTLHSELWKRAFWCLVCHERHMSAALGRPYYIDDEEIDAEFPLECDDEYWLHPDPEKAFKQPPDKPSRMIYFTLLLKEIRMLGSALRAIYTSRRYQALFGRSGQDWEQRVLADMDSAANQWFDSIPSHLRWIPNGSDAITYRQSAFLHVTYYHNQILVHRPFITSKNTSLSLSCVAICTNAARCIIGIADLLRRSSANSPGVLAPTFNACMYLLLQAWGSKRSGTATDPERAMVEVHKGLDVLKALERRWSVAGALWDIIWELGIIGELPLANPPASSNFKRTRDTDVSPSQDASPSASDHMKSESPRGSSSALPSTLGVMHSETSSLHVPGLNDTESWDTSLDSTDPIDTDGMCPNSSSSWSSVLDDTLWQRPPYTSLTESSSSTEGQISAHRHDLYRQYIESTAMNMNLHPFDDTPVLGLRAPPNTFSMDKSRTSSSASGLGSSIFGDVEETPPQNLSSTSGILPDFGSAHGAAPAQNGLASHGWAQNLSSFNLTGSAATFDQDTLMMLSSVPGGFDFEGWNTYLNNMGSLMHGASSSTGR